MVSAIEEEGWHYLVMEYVGGGSLQDWLAAQGRLPRTRAVEIALDLAGVLTLEQTIDLALSGEASIEATGLFRR